MFGSNESTNPPGKILSLLGPRHLGNLYDENSQENFGLRLFELSGIPRAVSNR